MGDGYNVLIWDGFGVGLVMINPRLLAEGVDSQGNPCNWWSCPVGMSEEEKTEFVIRERKLPWLDSEFAAPGESADDAWQGSAFGSTDYSRWKIIG